MAFQDIFNNVKSAALSIGESLTPVLKETKFRETGVLTPEEYVEAGDHLVHHCPTWKWSAASNPSKSRDFLPADKQFLITRNVPCHKRCKQMEYDEKLEKIINDDEGEYATGDESGWVDTHHYEKEKTETSTPATIATSSPPTAAAAAQNAPDDSDSDGEAIDLDDLIESGAIDEEDPNRFVAPTHAAAGADGNTAEVEKIRTYDLHICYDKYYQVPRLFLMGYDENRRPLTVEQTYEDFSADHSNKTITVEAHPCVDLTMPTVHPCKHAEMMKRLINQYAESGKELRVQEYLFLFLKFVQAVIPTIEYDFTRAIKL